MTTPLTSNLTYTAIITATDTGGTTESTNVFDTIIPAYTWEAEDYDYGGGKFIDNPQTNAYSGLVATDKVDAYNPNGGGAANSLVVLYRPVNTGTDTGGDLGTEPNSDRPRAQYVSCGPDDYDQGWNTGGSGLWGNYTRHYPAGHWIIYARCATWAAQRRVAELLQRVGRPGRSSANSLCPRRTTRRWTQTSTKIIPGTPLTDVAGNLVEWDTDGSQQTLTMMIVSGNCNFNFYMLVPINPSYKPIPFVSAISPNGSTQMFPYTNLFAFTANSVPGITTNDVVVTLNGIAPVRPDLQRLVPCFDGHHPDSDQCNLFSGDYLDGRQWVEHLHHVLRHVLPQQLHVRMRGL